MAWAKRILSYTFAQCRTTLESNPVTWAIWIFYFTTTSSLIIFLLSFLNFIYIPVCLQLLFLGLFLSNLSIILVVCAFVNFKRLGSFLLKIVLFICGLMFIVGIVLILVGLIKLFWDISVYLFKVLMDRLRKILPKPDPRSGSNQRPGSGPNGPQGPNSSVPGYEEDNRRRRKWFKIVDKHSSDAAEDDASFDSSYRIKPKDAVHYRNVYNKLCDNFDKPMKDIDFTNAEHTVLHRAFDNSVQPGMTREEYLNCKATNIAKILAARRASSLE